MKRISIFCIVLCGMILSAVAQTAAVRGTVTDISGAPLAGVSVEIGAQKTPTDAAGKFVLTGLGFGAADIIFILPGFDTLQRSIEVSRSVVDLGYIQLKAASGVLPGAKAEGDYAFGFPVQTDALMMESVPWIDIDGESREQYVAGLLHSSTDVFASAAGYTLGAGYFRPRGYDNKFSEVLFNGLLMMDPETGRPTWTYWSGLNDATRFKESALGLTPARFSFGSLGGTTNIDARPSHYRAQTKVSYAHSNRTYRHRAMATYSTGLMKNGWAVMASASTRLANDGFVQGTPYEAYSYFLGIEKRIGKKHFIGLTGFGAPSKKGLQGAAVQEVYELLGTNYYNPNWGYQDGKERSARIRSIHKPVITLSHYYDINNKTRMTTSAGYSFGHMSTSSLNWYNAADPRPDYYRYLPSFQTDPTLAGEVAQAWTENPAKSQINWDYLYQVNLLANQQGERAKYILEERRMDHSQFGLSTHINHEMNNHVFISGGLNAGVYTSRNYKTIKDLLGGEYWIDIDQFAERDYSGDSLMLQNDLDNPDKIVKTGDVYGYNYDVHVNSANIWGLAEFTYNRLDFYVALNVSGRQLWRDGNMRNGRFPENSFGKSDKNLFLNYAAKGGLTYKITGRHYLVLNSGYFDVAPQFNEVFQAPRINNLMIPDVKNKRVFSADLSYIIRTPLVKGRITVYESRFWDDSKVSGFYHDELRTFVDYVIVGMNKVNQGIEIGAEVKIIPSLFATIAASLGNYRFTNRPTAYISTENGSRPDTSELIYAKNFFLSGTPQTAGTLGLKYQGPRYWFANLNASVFANNWTDFNPSRRTENAVEGLGPGDPLIETITTQTRAFDKPQFTVDASIGKSFRVKRYFINVNASVSNLLNNTGLVTTSYEQYRFDFDTKNIAKFPPKYYYAFGRTYFMMVSFRF